MSEPSPNDVERRYPALALLGRVRRRRRVPFLQQMAATECGAACLAMVLGYHGKEVTVEAVVDVMGSGRDGANLLQLTHAARWFGLRTRGVQLDVGELHLLEPGTILHWDFKHFVIFERRRKADVEIVDPAQGRRCVPFDELRRSFTGLALMTEPGERFTLASRPPSTIWRYLAQTLKRSGSWLRIIVTSLLLQLFALAFPLLTALIVDLVVPRTDAGLITTAAAGLAVICGLHFVTTLVRAHLLLHLRTHFDSRMTLGFLDHLLQLRFAFFQQRPTGDLMNRVNSNATIREMLTSGTLSALIDGTLVLGYFLILLIISGSLAFTCFILAAVQVLVFMASWRRQRDLIAASLRAQSASESYLVEMLSGIEMLKASGTELDAVERWSRLFVDQLNVSLARGRLSALVDAISGVLRMASPLVLLCLGAARVVDHSLSLGVMLSTLAVAQGLLAPLGTLMGNASQLTLLGGYLERIEDVLSAPVEHDGRQTCPTPPLSGAISVENVSFRYAPTAPDVVRDVSLEVAPGAFVAIVGRSGSGKSTLASLLVGLHQPWRGRILYDGHDVAALDLGSLRRQLGIVTQRAHLFGASIRTNISHNDPSLPLERVMEAARQAGIHDEIMAMPMKYDTLLTDGGASLSGGQRQRIALARALAAVPAVLLLDEATSALDVVAERAVQARVAALGCTRVVIAHRLSTVENADVIFVMERGQIVEHGTHAELLARGRVYSALVSAQRALPRPEVA